ncbi:MAG: DUF3515 domain-containing protein [Actinobacteria bacterium]|nr:DUF3515 domain-containing protein [Actinomycetota bacterium]
MKFARLTLGIALVVLSGCANKIAISAPTPDASTSAVCKNALADLPELVADQKRRTVEDSSGLTAGWGDPVITLRCGVEKPAELKPTSSLVTVNSIDWFAQELTNGMRFTSINTKVYVEVSVPSTYQPEGNALVDLTQALNDLVVLGSK